MPAVSPGTRFFSQLLLKASVVLLCAQSTVALPQTASGTPESVVLVLKLVSSTHVRPTTGVVISNDGMVLVPADFVAAGDEIVIMQGGTDIIRNGRPSRTVKRSAADGLAVLSAEGLKRPPIILSEDRLLQDHVYHLAAFPPADKLAEGAQPLWVPVKLTKNSATGGFEISTSTPLPPSTGPIIDNCGYLVGLNLAEGEDAVVVLGDEMSVIFDSMQIGLQSSTCQTPAQTKVIPAKPDIEKPDIEKPVDPPVQTNAEADEKKTASSAINTAADSPTIVVSRPSVLGILPVWLWLIGGAVLIAVLAKLIFFLRLGKHEPWLSPDEPDTAELETQAVQQETVDRFDGEVVIEGSLGDGTPVRHACKVNTKQIDVVIGHGDADICIEAAAVSSRHARLKNIGKSLTISDLGSDHGTFIRGIPCLPNEVMMIYPEDEILLGDVHVNINVNNINVNSSHGDSK